jgi:pyruvate dehydrogenase E1 component alpha subunit
MNSRISKKDLIDFERHIAELYDDGQIPYLVHLCGGNEDQLIEIFKDIKPDDYVFSTHRNTYHYLLHGGSPGTLEQKILNGKSMFIFDRKLNFFSLSIVAATPGIAAGTSWALKRKGSKQKVWCFVGDGTEDEGHFYEAVRYVDGWNLPCIFIIEDNDRSVKATKKDRWNEGSNFIWNKKCVRKYCYSPTYPHSGSGSNKWVKFKREAKIVRRPKRKTSDIDIATSVETSMTYFDAVKSSMEMLAKNPSTIFVGYNVKYGSAYGSLKNIPEDQRVETPVAENLMAGLALGMSLEGYRPVLFFERHDFILNAADLIVNTLDVIETISDGEYSMPIVIKAVVGSIKPFYAGITHSQDFSDLIRGFVSFPVYTPINAKQVLAVYDKARTTIGPMMISERKELY